MEQLYQSTPFLFAPLGSNTPAPTASNNILLPNPTVSSNALSPIIFTPPNLNPAPPTTKMPPVIFTTSITPTTSTPDMGVVIFQPTVVSPSGGSGPVIQPIPNQGSTQGTLISQTVQQPVINPTPAPTCGVSRGTINRVVGGYEARRGIINLPKVFHYTHLFIILRKLSLDGCFGLSR